MSARTCRLLFPLWTGDVFGSTSGGDWISVILQAESPPFILIKHGVDSGDSFKAAGFEFDSRLPPQNRLVAAVPATYAY